MTPIVVLPLADFTIEPESAEPGPVVFDANRAFIERLTAADSLAALAGQLDAAQASPQRAGHALFVRAAAQIRGQADGDGDTMLRAVGVGLRAASLDDPGLTVTVDDLELVGGSTESSADTVSAAGRTELFTPEVEQAAQFVRQVGSARVTLDGDQQLPAVLRLAQLTGADRLVLCGRFADRHRAALGRLGALAGVRFGPSIPYRVRLSSLGPDPVRWATATGEVPSAGPWVGWLDATELADLDSSILDRCRGLTVTVAALPSWERALGLSGRPADLRPVRDRLGRHGVPLGVELLVGAPGTPVESVREAVERLDAAGDSVRLAGFRPFRLPAEHGAEWAGTSLPPSIVDDRRDLARWRQAAHDRGAISTLLADTVIEHDLYPGRLAAAALAVAQWHEVGPEDRWDPAARVVRAEGAGPDGRGPGAFLANVRTGQLQRAEDRFAAVLQRLSSGGAGASAVLARLPADRRDSLLARLRAAGALRRKR